MVGIAQSKLCLAYNPCRLTRLSCRRATPVDSNTPNLVLKCSKSDPSRHMTIMWSLRWLRPAAGSPQHRVCRFVHKSKAQWSCWRSFQSGARQLAGKKSPIPAKKAHPSSPSTLRAAPLNKSPGAAYKSYSDVLAARSSPTLLYQASAPLLYITGCYILSGFCFFYAGWNFYATYLNPSESLGSWLPIMIGGVCVGMAFFGTWVLFGVRCASIL